jgi:hypothetical protein
MLKLQLVPGLCSLVRVYPNEILLALGVSSDAALHEHYHSDMVHSST